MMTSFISILHSRICSALRDSLACTPCFAWWVACNNSIPCSRRTLQDGATQCKFSFSWLPVEEVAGTWYSGPPRAVWSACARTGRDFLSCPRGHAYFRGFARNLASRVGKRPETQIDPRSWKVGVFCRAPILNLRYQLSLSICAPLKDELTQEDCDLHLLRSTKRLFSACLLRLKRCFLFQVQEWMIRIQNRQYFV